MCVSLSLAPIIPTCAQCSQHAVAAEAGRPELMLSVRTPVVIFRLSRCCCSWLSSPQLCNWDTVAMCGDSKGEGSQPLGHDSLQVSCSASARADGQTCRTAQAVLLVLASFKIFCTGSCGSLRMCVTYGTCQTVLCLIPRAARSSVCVEKTKLLGRQFQASGRIESANKE